MPASHAFSQDQLVEKGAREDGSGSLTVRRPNQFLHGLRTEPGGVDDLEHAAELDFLTMLVVDDERDCQGALRLSEVAQVHERALREESKVQVAKPDEEASAHRLEDACIPVKGLLSTETCLGFKEVFACCLLLEAGH